MILHKLTLNAAMVAFYSIIVATVPVVLSMNTSVDLEEDAYVRLTNHVLSHPRIMYKIPPSHGPGNAVNINFYPFQILSVSDVDQSVTITSLVALSWYIPNIGWNSSDFGGLRLYFIDSSLLWNPVIILPKSTDVYEVEMSPVLTLTSKGVIEANIPMKFSTFCYLNLEKFPFDEHKCIVPIIEINAISLHCASSQAWLSDLAKYFATSAEWDILDHGCQPEQQAFETVVGNYTVHWFTMRRKSMYFVSVLILPVVIMGIVALMVFWIPAESGEKISFVVSILVSMFVFLLLINEIVPRSMETMPRSMTFIVSVVLEIVCIIAATACVLRRYHRREADRKQCEDHRVQPWACGCVKGEGSREGNFTDQDSMGHRQPKNLNPPTRRQKHPLMPESTSEAWKPDVMVSDSPASVDRHPPGARKRELGSDLKLNFLFQRELTHQQLDKVFFIFFLVLVTVVNLLIFVA